MCCNFLGIYLESNVHIQYVCMYYMCIYIYFFLFFVFIFFFIHVHVFLDLVHTPVKFNMDSEKNDGWKAIFFFKSNFLRGYLKLRGRRQ